jgi:hypothetical protein
MEELEELSVLALEGAIDINEKIRDQKFILSNERESIRAMFDGAVQRGNFLNVAALALLIEEINNRE